MDDSMPTRLEQPVLFELIDVSSGAAELFPAVWIAMEDLASPEARLRSDALDRLLEMEAARISPLVSYNLATRLTDPDLEVRTRVATAIGELLAPDGEGRPSPDIVLRHMSAYLSQMRTRVIFGLLEIAEYAPEVERHIARIFNACPYAGVHLIEILSERRFAFHIRRKAARFIELVGFVEAIPALERLASRLASRLDGQQSMPFAPPAAMDETRLLPAIQQALLILKIP